MGGWISEEELHVDGYTTFRKDRISDIKGGGVLIYAKDNLTVSEFKLDNEFPEQVWCKLKYDGNRELLIGVCYRTPSENVYENGVYQQLREMIQEVSNRDFILIDFNYTGIN